MNPNQHEPSHVRASPGRHLVHAVARSVKALAAVVAECHQAQRVMSELRIQPDRYALDGDQPPDSYAEFLFRSPGTVWREPSARERADSAAPRHR